MWQQQQQQAKQQSQSSRIKTREDCSAEGAVQPYSFRRGVCTETPMPTPPLTSPPTPASTPVTSASANKKSDSAGNVERFLGRCPLAARGCLVGLFRSDFSRVSRVRGQTGVPQAIRPVVPALTTQPMHTCNSHSCNSHFESSPLLMHFQFSVQTGVIPGCFPCDGGSSQQITTS